MVWSITRRAPAKLNLTLEILSQRGDGYHDVRSIFVRLDRLADVVSMRVDEDGSAIRISASSPDVPADSTNICHQAVERYLSTAGITAAVDIHIDKHIPVAAGLGGGSSDAATVLLALNARFARLSAEQLAVLGRGIGADVCFFLRRTRAADVSGVGDVVKPLTSSLPRIRFLIVNPCIAVSTREAFHALDKELWLMAHAGRANVTRSMAKAIAACDIGRIAAALHNDFEVVIERMHPVVNELKHALRAFGAAGASMSGSGPTVFGLFDSARALAIAEEALRRHYPAFITAAA
jgi:4-diphosphocytidyl-2-C-methyl-D-erythritol kinase